MDASAAAPACPVSPVPTPAQPPADGARGPWGLFLVLLISVLACNAVLPGGLVREVERLETPQLREPLLRLLAQWSGTRVAGVLHDGREGVEAGLARWRPALESLVATMVPPVSRSAVVSAAVMVENVAPAPVRPAPLEVEALIAESTATTGGLPPPAGTDMTLAVASAPAVPPGDLPRVDVPSASLPPAEEMLPADSPEWARRLTQARRILIAGDSMAQTIPPPLSRRLRQRDGYQLIDASRPSTGLVQPNLYDWPAKLAEWIEREKPELVILMLGANDKLDIRVDGGYLRFPKPDWETEYRRRVGGMIELATRRNIPVLWVGLPVMRHGGYDKSMAMLTALYEEEARLRGQFFLSIRGLMADAEGNYAHHLIVGGRERLVRASDGIHFSMAGAEILADAVAAALQTQPEVADAR